MEARDLGPLLTRLSESIRADVRMRLRIEVGRARIRTSSKIVLAVTLFTMAMIYFTSEDLLEVYDTGEGQVWLLGVFALFMGALGLMNHYARVEVRPSGSRPGGDGIARGSGGEGRMNDTVIAMVLAAGVGLRAVRDPAEPPPSARSSWPNWLAHLAERRELQPWAVPDLHRPPLRAISARSSAT